MRVAVPAPGVQRRAQHNSYPATDARTPRAGSAVTCEPASRRATVIGSATCWVEPFLVA